jgi:hypothetical protein
MLPIDAFKPPRGAGIAWNKCLDCTRLYHRRRQMFKWSAGDVEPDTNCPLCLKPYGPSKNDSPHMDHDHETNTFRGWICGRCNIALGHVLDDIDTLRRAITYLEQHKEKIKDLKTTVSLSGVPEEMSDHMINALEQVMKKRQGDVK